MDIDKKIKLISRNTQEIIDVSELRELLEKKKKPTAYVGYAPTGKLHIGYLIPLLKVLDFVKAGFKFKFLFADLHAHLDDLKTPWELLDARVKYYETGIKAMIKALGGDITEIEFVRGSDFQYEKKYIENIFRLASLVTEARARRAAAEVVRFGEQPKLGGFLYPILQVADVVALGADVAFGGIDQRGVYMLGRDVLPKIGQEKYVCVFTPLLPGLTGGKMSASVEGSKIDILDSEEEVTKKIKSAYCPEREVDGNGVLAYCEYMIFPHLENQKRKLIIERSEKFGGNIEFENYLDLEKIFVSGKLHPADLKSAVAKEINLILDSVRKSVKNDIVEKAYLLR